MERIIPFVYNSVTPIKCRLCNESTIDLGLQLA